MVGGSANNVDAVHRFSRQIVRLLVVINTSFPNVARRKIPSRLALFRSGHCDGIKDHRLPLGEWWTSTTSFKLGYRPDSASNSIDSARAAKVTGSSHQC